VDNKKTYIGDGAFVSNDGWSIIVECDRENGRNFVHLEPDMVVRLVEYGFEIGLLNAGYFKRMAEKYE